MKKIFSLALCACLLLTSAVGLAAATPTDAAKVNASYAAAQQNFGFDLLRQLDKSGKNTVISSYSIAQALELTAPGAKGRTQSQLLKALKLNSLKKYASYSAVQRTSLNKLDEINIANALFVRQDYALNDAYLQAVKAYEANVKNVDFSDPAAVEEFNAWVKEETRGKITKMYDEFDPSIALLIANAVSFDAKWDNPFDANDTSLEKFYGKSKTTEVKTMHTTGPMDYYKGKNFSMVRLPYENERLSMLIMLPTGRTSVSTMLRSLTAKNLAAYTGKFQQSFVSLSLPKFKVESDISLKSLLQKLGVKDAFDAKRVDLSGIAGEKGDLVVNEVKHKAMIEVDEEGTKAGAVTVVEVMPTSAPQTIEMLVNKPFAFLLWDEQTNTVLFSGVVYDLQ